MLTLFHVRHLVNRNQLESEVLLCLFELSDILFCNCAPCYSIDYKKNYNEQDRQLHLCIADMPTATPLFYGHAESCISVLWTIPSVTPLYCGPVDKLCVYHCLDVLPLRDIISFT